MQKFSSYNWFTQQWKPENTYYIAIPWATQRQFYNVIANTKVDE